jgi:hypothetical protein
VRFVTCLEHGLRSFNGEYFFTYITDLIWILMLWFRAIQFPVTKALPYIFTSFGYGTWYFFASWMLVATAWAYFFVPETKGLTIDQMDYVLYVTQLFESAPTFTNFSFCIVVITPMRHTQFLIPHAPRRRFLDSLRILKLRRLFQFEDESDSGQHRESYCTSILICYCSN